MHLPVCHVHIPLRGWLWVEGRKLFLGKRDRGLPLLLGKSRRWQRGQQEGTQQEDGG